MFKKLFGKTASKAEKAIDKAAEDVDDVLTNVKNLVGSVKTITTLATVGLVLGIASNIISIVVDSRKL